MSIKNESRLRRAKKTRMRIKSQDLPRLTVFKSSQHIYAQIIDDDKGHTLVAASSLEEEVRSSGVKGIEAAEKIGQLLGQRAKAAGINSIVFDRGGLKYHGRIAAVADAAREAGLEF